MAGIVKHYEVTVNGNTSLNRRGFAALCEQTNRHISTTRQQAAYREILNSGQGWRKKLRAVWQFAAPLFEAAGAVTVQVIEYKHYRKRRGQAFHRLAESLYAHRNPRNGLNRRRQPAAPRPPRTLDARLAAAVRRLREERDL